MSSAVAKRSRSSSVWSFPGWTGLFVAHRDARARDVLGVDETRRIRADEGLRMACRGLDSSVAALPRKEDTQPHVDQHLKTTNAQ